MKEDKKKSGPRKTNKSISFAEKIQTINIDRRLFMKYVGTVMGAAALGSMINTFGCAPSQPAETPAPGNEPGDPNAPSSNIGSAGLIVKKGSPMVCIYYSLVNDYYLYMAKGGQQAVEALGMKYEEYHCEGEPEKLLSQFETAAARGVKMFFMEVPPYASSSMIADAAKEYQSYFTGVWVNDDWYHPLEGGDYYVSYFIPNSIQTGYEMAKSLFDAIDGSGNVVHLEGYPGSPADWGRTVGVHKALAEYPNIKLLDSHPAEWNRHVARTVMEDFITRYPKIDAVIGQNDDIGIGAMNALEDAGIDPKTVPICGNDGNKETMELIREGKYHSVITHYPFWTGGNAAVRVFDAANGWKPSVPERMMNYGHILINKDNVDAYYNKFYAQEKFPIDWQKMSKVLHPDDWDPQNELKPIKLENMYATREKPPGWEPHPEYTKALEEGEFERIEQLYKDHYKNKIDDFTGF